MYTIEKIHRKLVVRSIRIYQPGIFSLHQIYALTPDAGQHVGVVLRMQPGDELTLFDGENHEYEACITEVHKKRVMVLINSEQTISRESPRLLHLAQAIAKGDRMEWLVQKAVELGVSSIRPLITERCALKLDKDRLIKKCAQWQAIAIAACEQCGRNQIPQILTPHGFEEYVRQSQSTIKFILHPEGAKRWQDYDFSVGEIDLLIGPEGGFSDSELGVAKMAGFESLRLGPRVLRTETAGIVALSLLQGVLGDL